MGTYSHVVNPVEFPSTHPLHTAQAVTLASMAAAAAHPDAPPVALVSAQFPEDRGAAPPGFVLTPDLQRSILDLGPFTPPRKLPLLADLLDRGHGAGPADHLVFTNIDIGLMPFFYVEVERLVRAGHVSFAINRRTIAAEPRDPAGLTALYAQVGAPHRGFDCFVFPRAWVPELELGRVTSGVPWIGRLLLANLGCLDPGFTVFTDRHLTFHLGDDRAWTSAADRPYRDHNLREARRALVALARRHGPAGPVRVASLRWLSARARGLVRDHLPAGRRR